MNNKVKNIIEQINSMDTNELIDLNNTYCNSANISDSEIYENGEEFFNMFFEGDVMRAIQATHYGDYNYSHDWVRFNGYGNLDSIQYMSPDDLCECVETMAEYISENENDFTHLFEFIEEETEC